MLLQRRGRDALHVGGAAQATQAQRRASLAGAATVLALLGNHHGLLHSHIATVHGPEPPIPGRHVGSMFEHLAWATTHEGVLTLWRRREPVRDVDVYEVKLDDEYLMSSLFTVAEVELARLALAAVTRADLDVVVGGLGLGYTARAVLEDDRVRALVVVEALSPVIDWHHQDLVPGASALTSDPRARLVHGDFFAMAAGDGFHPDQPGRQVDAIIVDIDHTPRHVLHPSHAPFYAADGLRRLRDHLRPGGVFALWSDDPPDADFQSVLDEVFATARAHEVVFPNFLTGGQSSNTVFVARS